MERGARLGGKGLIAFRGRVRTSTTEVSTGWLARDGGMSNLATACQGLARVSACLYLSAKLSTPLHALLLNGQLYTVVKGCLI